MKIRAKEVKATVNLLVDPNPTRMSFVDNGANQTPWNSVKRDRVRRRPTKETRTMKNKAGKGSARKGFLTKMQFSKEHFATKADVKKYFEDSDIEGYGAITDGDDVWIVKSTDAPPKTGIGKAASTPGNVDGVTAFIAPINAAKADASDEDDDDQEDTSKSDDEDEDGEDEDGEDAGDEDEDDEDDEDEDDEDDVKPKARKGATKARIVNDKAVKKGVKAKPTAKSRRVVKSDDPVLELPPTLAIKYDWFGSYVSGDTTLSGVLSDGSYDGMPPGLETVLMAAGFTIGNILSDDGSSDAEKLASLKQAGEEQANFAMGLYNLFKKANADVTKSASRTTRKGAAAYIDSFTASVDSIAKIAFDNVIETNDDEDDDEIEAPKPKARKSATAKKPSTKSKAKIEADDEDEDGAVGNALLEALGKITKRLDRVDREMSRATTSKSMSDSIDDIIGDDEDDDEDIERSEARKAEIRRSMGLRADA